MKQDQDQDADLDRLQLLVQKKAKSLLYGGLVDVANDSSDSTVAVAAVAAGAGLSGTGSGMVAKKAVMYELQGDEEEGMKQAS